MEKSNPEEDNNQVKTRQTFSMSDITDRAHESGCYVEFEFDIFEGSGNGDGTFSEGGTFTAHFIPFDCKPSKPVDMAEEDITYFESIQEYDIAQLNQALAELTTIDDVQKNELLNAWHVEAHDYNDDFTIEWTQEDEDILNEISDEMQKTEATKAFDRAKIDPESL